MSQMSKPKVVRTASTPVMIPDKRRSELRRKVSVGTPTKSILIKRDSSRASSPTDSYASSPRGTPDKPIASSFPKRKISQVRFLESNVESPDYYLFNKDGNSKDGKAIANPMTVYRKISLEKIVGVRHDDDSDSLHGLEGSDEDDDDDDDMDRFYDSDSEQHRDDSSTKSNSPQPRLSSSMSTEAQYAILKAYEDEMYEKIAKTFPGVSERLEANRCQTPDIRHSLPGEIDDLDDDASIVSHTESVSKVAHRIQRAMDILDSVRESNGELITSNKCCSNRSIAKNPVKSFERWCSSLRDVLQEVK